MGLEIYALVPVKPFRRAKSRLSPVASKPIRAALARALLARTLDVLAASSIRLDGLRICMVSRDITALDMARRRGVAALAETEPGQNEALDQARRWAVGRGAQGVLVLPADLPGVLPEDVEAMIRLGRERHCAVIAPDAQGQGTNALFLRPPDALNLAFGPHSFPEHCAQAETSQLALHIYRSPTVALDLDTPADLKHLALDVTRFRG